jgi:hypothetical protein
MNLLQLRQQFRTISGRHDLVNPDGSDNGADFYINEGIKYLDRLGENQKSWASRFLWLQPGLWGVQFEHCRAIKEVWVSVATERWQLEKKRIQDLKSEYMSDLPSARGTGDPLYYAPTHTRYIPEDAQVGNIEAFVGFVDIPASNAHLYNSILIAPPAAELVSVEVVGLFYNKALVADTDENYWSVTHSFLLIMAAMRQLEVINRNTQGVNDWEAVIQRDMISIDFDLVEELVAEVDDMEG